MVQIVNHVYASVASFHYAHMTTACSMDCFWTEWLEILGDTYHYDKHDGTEWLFMVVRIVILFSLYFSK